jgi:hypothetical protein
MNDNVFAIKRNNNPKRVLKMIELFSFWITFHYFIFLLFQNYLPSWTNPTFWVFYGFFAQVSLFILGRNIMPFWFKVSVFIWKFSILMLTLMTIPYNMSYSAINFNLALFLVYIAILHYLYKTDVIEVYLNGILTRKYHNITINKFIFNRLRNIF